MAQWVVVGNAADVPCNPLATTTPATGRRSDEVSNLGEAIGRAIAAQMLALIAGAFVLGGLLVWLLPKLWAWLKPLIHAATS